jgi:LuxR family maltose regulon positive regulatory protein
MTRISGNDDARARDRFAAPPPGAGLALRAAILERLSAPGVRVGTITAPAGYGKTSHAAAWVAGDDRPAAWIDVEDVHDDATVLLTDLVAALKSVTGFADDGLDTRGAGPSQYTTRVVPAFGRAVRNCTRPFVLVLDDAHRVDDQFARDVLVALLSNVPTGSTVLLVGRASHAEMLSRLRVDPTVVEIVVDDLALESAAVAVVLAGMGIECTDEQVKRVVADTEGWPVGVRLAGLAALADVQLGELGPRGLRGRESNVFDYIGSEWLWGLRDDDREFLMRVSPLDWLSGALCNEVLDRDDSGEVLHRIFNDRLLVIPLDRRESAYRMHVLLRDALSAQFERCDATAFRRVNQRASAWFEASGDIDRAFRHAVMAGDVDRAERLVVDHTAACYTNGQYTTLAGWIESLPHDRVRRSPALCLSAALAAWGQGQPAKLSIWLRLGEEAAESTPEPDVTARLCLLELRSTTSTGPVRPALDAASAAHAGLAPGIWHAASCMEYGVWSWTAGDDIAEKVLTEGAEEAAVFGAATIEAGCIAVLAMIAYTEGDTARAWPLVARARKVVVDNALEHAPGAAIVSAMSALARASTGEPEGARHDWHLARTQLALVKDVLGWVNVLARLALAQASLLLGDRIGAETMVREVHEFLLRQPDANQAHHQVAKIEELVRHTQRHTLIGSSALTTAELRVLHHLPTNLTLAEIGDRLYVSRYTVKTHCESIYRKLNVNCRSDAVEAARAVGLLAGTEPEVV